MACREGVGALLSALAALDLRLFLHNLATRLVCPHCGRQACRLLLHSTSINCWFRASPASTAWQPNFLC